MTSEGESAPPPTPPPTPPAVRGIPAVPGIMVKLPGITLTGAPAVVALLVLVAAIVALVVWIGPTWSWSPLWISAALWLAFSLYWGVPEKNAAKTASRESHRSRQFHQMLMNASLVLLFARIPGLTHRLWPQNALFVVAGLLLHLLCVLLAIWARRHLGRFWSGEIAAKAGHELIRSGPYRRLRHPIYTAMVGMCIATALVSGELHAAAGVALMVAAYVRKIRLEERHLDRLYGALYADYRKASWALVPWLI